MPPSEFWGTDTWTVMDAYDGFLASRGIKVAGDDRLTQADIEEMQRMMDEHEKRTTQRAGRT